MDFKEAELMKRSWQLDVRIDATTPSKQKSKKDVPLWAVFIAVGVIGIALFVAGLLVGQAILSGSEVVFGVGVKLP